MPTQKKSNFWLDILCQLVNVFLKVHDKIHVAEPGTNM